MTTFGSRRARFIALTLVTAALLAWLDWLYGLSLRDASFLSGWLMFSGVVFLTFFNVRKKLPFLPLFDSSLWLQVHIYLGLLVSFMFLLHTSLRLPNGVFETALWWAFVLLALSGIVGLFLSRVLPNRLRQRGERVIFERIPKFRAELAEEVEELAMRSVTESGSNTIASYYSGRLHEFFQGPRNQLAYLRGTLEPSNKLHEELASLRRYLNAEEQAILVEIEARVGLKDDLDRQFAIQSVLKGWLFVHIPLTYLLLLLSLYHIVLVYAFTKGSL